MIRRFQALGYRCLRYVDLELDRFQVLVGANASGKSTLFDALSFLEGLVDVGLFKTIESRGGNFQDLVWKRPEMALGFELAVEVEIPSSGLAVYADGRYDRVRYEVEIREDSSRGLHIAREQWFPLSADPPATSARDRFPDPPTPPDTLFTRFGTGQSVTAPNDLPGGGDRTPLEVAYPVEGAQNRDSPLSALGRLPAVPGDEFAVHHWLKRELGGTVSMSLDSDALRRPSPPNMFRYPLTRNGSTLPWLVDRLRAEEREDYEEWIHHVTAFLPDISSVETVVRPEDRRAYLVVRYASGIFAPAWSVSDGTLRLLALTLLAYLPSETVPCRRFFIEEPENGLHPDAVDAVYDSLASVYDQQVFVATHSPAILRRAYPEEIFCFARVEDDTTDIVRGDHHPMLREWKENVDTTALFSTGVFG